MNLPEKLLSLKPYDPADFTPKFKLDANESFINPPDTLLDKLRGAIMSVDLKRYPDPFASELCAEASCLYGVTSDSIVASNGSDEMISILFNSFLNKGDRVLISEPDFSMYRFYAHLAEASVISADKRKLVMDIDEIIRLAKENNVSLIIFSNPCNPTGTGVKRADIIKLINSVDCLVIIDEAYMEFWDESVVRDVSAFSNAIVLRTCSKAFGIAGVRLGFAVSNKKIIDLIKTAKSPFNVNSLTQTVGLTVIREKKYLNQCIDRIKKSKDLLFDMLSKLACEYPGFIFVYQTVSNFVLIKSHLSQLLYDTLIMNGILIRRVMGDYLRITAGSDVENLEVIGCIREFLKKEGSDGK